MEIANGLRVVRGPNWKWGDQDGGEGFLGTVVDSQGGVETEDGVTMGKGVVVQWDCGNRSNYRCGVDGQYDLRVCDSAPSGTKHSNIICDSCKKIGVAGIRWKCSKCNDFDLCTPCYNAGKHSLEHKFCRVDEPNGRRCLVSNRLSARKVTTKGIFPSAEVVRGHDWLWGDQDGGLGKSGKVHDIKGWEEETERSVAEVVWADRSRKNVYRVGHKGKVDLKCMKTGDGGCYYPDHLPILGAPYAKEDDLTIQTAKLASGDQVKVQLDVEVFKMMQQGHGGWNEQMAKVIGEVGSVHSVLDSGDLRVCYSSNRTWTMNPDAVTKVGENAALPNLDDDETTPMLSAGDVLGMQVQEYATGDVVRIINDIARVHDLQDGHGGWVDDIALALGQVGRVIRVFPTGDVRVAVSNSAWTFNPLCMVPAPGEPVPDTAAVEEPESDDLEFHMQLLALLENPAVLVCAASTGDVGSIRSFLVKHPKEVNAKVSGKAAVHCASLSGSIPVLKALIEFSADLEIPDPDGDRPLHLAAYSDEDEAVKVLVDAGAILNSTNSRGATPLIIAAVKGSNSVLKVLAALPNIKLHEQDVDGDTALHCAVLAQKNESVAVLLEANADPTLLNFRLFTPIHEAAKIGFLPALEQFARKFPQHTNLKKDDGFTILHLAAMNDHLDIVTFLSELDACDINSVTNSGETALHLAVQQGHYRIVERLVGFGASLNIVDHDGNTCLHHALASQVPGSISADAPQIQKIKESFGTQDEPSSRAGAAVACFLVQEGADNCIKNKKGLTALQLCSPGLASTITMLPRDSRAPKFHGSLRMEKSEALAKPYHQTLQTASQPPGLAVGASPLVVQDMLSSGAADQEVCFLCEAPVDVKFEPCGHALMCSDCAQRAKKCPKCKKPVKTFSKLKRVCPMCNDDEATVIVRPCGHQFCPGCARRMKVCFDCRIDIQSKDGLPAEALPIGVGEAAAACAICLTEPRNTVLVCGHQLCWECAQRVDHCPVCRKFITHRIRLFE